MQSSAARALSLKDLALLASKPLTDFEDKHLAKLKAKLVSDDFRKRPSRASYSEEENAVQWSFSRVCQLPPWLSVSLSAFPNSFWLKTAFPAAAAANSLS